MDGRHKLVVGVEDQDRAVVLVHRKTAAERTT
jgi:hypothetical protein